MIPTGLNVARRWKWEELKTTSEKDVLGWYQIKDDNMKRFGVSREDAQSRRQ